MNNILYYIFKFLLRIRWWVIIGSITATLIAIVLTKKLAKQYEVTATIYTGFVSGLDIENVGVEKRVDYAVVNNSMDNLINILASKETLKRVSLRLLVQHLMYGNPNKDNEYIKADNFRAIYSHVPQEVKDLIDKSSEERSLENITAYNNSSTSSYTYGLFNWNSPIYSYEALSKIIVKRVGSSDMLDLKYSFPDPGIAYNTLDLLAKEFIEQYKTLKYGEVDDVIKYFERELAIAKSKLTIAEDSLTHYNVTYKVINYEEETKQVASSNFFFEQNYEAILLRYVSAQQEIEQLDKNIGRYTENLKTNAKYLEKLDEIKNLSGIKAALMIDSTTTSGMGISEYNNLLDDRERDIMALSREVTANRYSRDGVPSVALLDQWIQAQIEFAKAEAELKVMDDRKKLIDDKYAYFSPIGTTIKRKEREIGFTENTYLNVLNALNAAKLRKRNIQLSSASLKVINPPVFPVASVPTKRKMIVLMVFFGSMLFIIGYFVLLELLDRTIRNKFRAERMIGGHVIAAYPKPNKFKYRMYNKQCDEIAIKSLANALLSYVTPSGPNVINILSNDRKERKTAISKKLAEYYEMAGLKSVVILSGEDFIPEGKDYLLAEDYRGIYDGEDDIVIIEHPACKYTSVPTSFLNHAAVNLFITRTDRVWTETDQMLYDNIIKKSGSVPVEICLSEAERDVVETFTGMLPPETVWRKFSYKLLQLGLTAK